MSNFEQKAIAPVANDGDRPTHSSLSINSNHSSKFQRSGKGKPCPICDRTKDTDCRLFDLVGFSQYKTALRRAKTYEEVRLIDQAAVDAAEQTQKTLKVVLNWFRKERKINPSTEKTIIVVFLTIAKFQYYEETDSLKAFNYSDIPVVLMLRQEYKEAKERASTARLKFYYHSEHVPMSAQ